MSWLLFDTKEGKLFLFAGKEPNVLVSALLGTWTAHNSTAKRSGGPFPKGTWEWLLYKDHIDQPGFFPGCFSTAYGCSGIHIFNIPGRTGMGIHAGRQTYDQFINNIPNGKTLGCIRTSDDALRSINSTHSIDKLTALVVQ